MHEKGENVPHIVLSLLTKNSFTLIPTFLLGVAISDSIGGDLGSSGGDSVSGGEGSGSSGMWVTLRYQCEQVLREQGKYYVGYIFAFLMHRGCMVHIVCT